MKHNAQFGNGSDQLLLQCSTACITTRLLSCSSLWQHTQWITIRLVQHYRLGSRRCVLPATPSADEFPLSQELNENEDRLVLLRRYRQLTTALTTNDGVLHTCVHVLLPLQHCYVTTEALKRHACVLLKLSCYNNITK